MPPRINMIGLRFDRLTVITDRDESGELLGTPEYLLVKVRCDCGNEKMISARSLRKGHAKSCGCLHLDRVTIHGLSDHPGYNIYRAMMSRCYRKSTVGYKDYGARGISVCAKWKNNPEAFVSWLESNGYVKGTTQIDRINNNGNYTPSNCRLVSRRDNLNNTRKNVFIKVNGECMTIANAARKYHIADTVLRQRISKLGWDSERAVNTKTRHWEKAA